MTYTNCSVCGFRGHTHEVRTHYQETHVGYVNVNIKPNLKAGTMELIIQSHVVETSIPLTKGKLNAIAVNGNWRRPRE